MVNSEDIRDEVQAEYASLMHADERATKTLDSNTLRAPISDIPLRPLLSVTPHSTVAEAIAEMVQHRMGCALVMTRGKLEGIFTERDVLTRVLAEGLDPHRTVIRDVMSAEPETLTPEAMVAFALDHMDMGGYRHVPIVTEEGLALGVLSVRDVLRYLAEFFPEEVLTLPHSHSAPPLHGG